MFYVYILYSHKDKKLYVGQTNDLDERIKRHTNGYVGATKHRLPISCIHSEMFDSRAEAMARELYLKSLWSGRFKQKLKIAFESTLQNK
jgi:putative endonuclease